MAQTGFNSPGKSSGSGTKSSSKNWIKGAIGRPGALHDALGIPQGQKIPEDRLNAAAKQKGRVGAEARLAKTLRKMH